MNTHVETFSTRKLSKELKDVLFTEAQAEAFEKQEQSLVTNGQLANGLEKLEQRMKLYNGATAVATVSVLAALNFFA